MNCKELRKNARNLAGGGLDYRRRAEAQAHLAACEACAAQLEAERQLTMAFRELKASHGGRHPFAGVELALQAAFRARAAERTVPARTLFRWRWAAVAAAGVIVAVVAFYAVMHRVPKEKINVVNAPVRQQPAAAETERVAAARTPPKLKLAHRRARSKAAEPVQVVTAFYQVPYAEPLRPDESKRIVRVQVPRSALVAFGFPIAAERAQEPINADVLVGDDNLARAIRLVGDWRPRPATRSARPVNANLVR